MAKSEQRDAFFDVLGAYAGAPAAREGAVPPITYAFG
jgi:hypothetical protein